jgi:hypothetical protein
VPTDDDDAPGWQTVLATCRQFLPLTL